ncbi:MAG: DUF2007 domain-containing protein [Patescibacteria group bacterium]|nr:DUF2007 domain-containing protein [Patescibacteria group bacterium]
MEIVIIKICDDLMEAEVYKSKLESEGIKSFIDAGVACINPLLTNAVGGIKLLVRDDDVERAKRILNLD